MRQRRLTLDGLADVLDRLAHLAGSATHRQPNDQKQPYKDTVKSTWYANYQLILPTGRDSNLPIELLSKGVSQDCWSVF
jgi:hypothetical protein